MLKKISMAFSLWFAIGLFCMQLEARSIPDVIYSSKNRYTILDLLGEGVFGKVYSARDSSGSMYAIKCYKNISDSRDFYLDPKREYQIGRKLNHPNIIRAYEYFSGKSKGKEVHYLVLQLVDGKKLYDIPRGCINLEETIKAYDHFLSALIHALAHDLVYLDLHFGNLMMNEDHEIMIIDIASFFTFDEIHEYFSTKVVKKGPRGEDNTLVKNMKLEQFFSRNPELFEKLQKTFDGHDLGDIVMKRKSRDHLVLSYMTYYFDKMTEACVQIVYKSNLDRKSRIDLRAKMKLFAWNYEEDVEEEIDRPILYYIQTLKQLSKTFGQPDKK